jgi:phage terminase small subunit
MKNGRTLTAVGSRTDATPLSEQHETFVAEFMSNGGNATAAYAVAYPHVTSRPVLWAAAARLRAMPDVAARLTELRTIAAEALNQHVATLALDAHELASASVHDLAPIELYGCRHCHGIDGRYQWRDVEELCRAIDACVKSANTPKPLPVPDAAGGYGYSSRAPVNPECETCRGHGVPIVRIVPTAELSAGARALYAGVTLRDNGTVERVLVEDRAKWAHMRNQLIGAYAPTKVEGRHAHLHVHKQAPDTRTPMTVDEALAALEYTP